MNLTEPSQSAPNPEQARPEACCESVLLGPAARRRPSQPVADNRPRPVRAVVRRAPRRDRIEHDGCSLRAAVGRVAR